MPGRACGALVLLVLVFAGVPSTAAAADGLLPTDFPGLTAAGKGTKVAREALPRAATPALRRAGTEGAAYRSASRRLTLGVFRLGATASARAQQAALARAPRLVRRGRRATRTSTLRVGTLVASVRLQGPRAEVAQLLTEARAYAKQVGDRLRRLENRTAWQRTLDQIRPDGSITPQTALQAFAIAYGSIPGATRPATRIGAAEPTLAISMVERVWGQLTPEQRAAIDRKLGAPHDAGQPRQARAAQTLTPDPQAQALADKYVDLYERLMPGSRAVVRVFRANQEIVAATTGGFAFADALMIREGGVWGVGAVQFCRVRIPPFGQRQAGTPFYELVLAHEVFHCAQQQLLGGGRPRGWWIEEGSADWAANAVFRVSRDVGGGNMLAWFQTPERSLLSRSYDAVGFWGAADTAGGPGTLWGKLPAVFRAGSAFESFALAGGTTAPLLETWPSGAYGLPDLGGPWQQRNPFAYTAAEARVPYASIFDDAVVNAAPYTVKLAVAGRDPDRPLLDVRRRAGSLRVGGRTDLGPVGTQVYCLGRCVCPPGKRSSLPPFQQVDAQGLKLALTGGAERGEAEVTYLPLKRFCRDREDDQQPSRPASTNGDPHMVSWDGLFFDFQAVGEFWLARSRSGDLAIQARQEPLRTNKNVTVNTQFALRVGRTRVNVSKPDAPGTPLEVRVDGRPLELAPGRAQPLTGGTLVRDADGRVTATWSDGSEFIVRSVGRWGVAASAQLAAARAGTVTGVLGRFDGDPGNDLADRDNRAIPYRVRDLGGGFSRVEGEFDKPFFDRLYEQVGEAWRLKQSESLLIYEPGRSTRSYTDRKRPTKPVDPADLARERRAAAERICRGRGVTEPGPLEDCILDVALTGDPVFADDALAVQEAGQIAWTALRTGADRVGGLDLLGTPDGALHLAFSARPGGARHVPIGPDGAEGGAEAVAPTETAPRLITGGPFGLGALTAELSGERNGIYRYARGGDGAWSVAGTVAERGYTYVSQPEALVLTDGTLMTVAPNAGRATVHRGEGGAPQDPLPELPDCYTTNPRLAQDGASGELWLAWVQWDCPEIGLFARRLDPATGAPAGPLLKAPGSTWGDGRRVDPPLGQELAFSGWRGADGVFLAYVTDDGRTVRLWRAGAPGSASVARPGGGVRRAFVSAEPAGGHLWLAWDENDRLSALRTADPAALSGRRRTYRPPSDARPPVLSSDHWALEARAGGADLLYGWVKDGETPGALWHARVTG